jgi:hypothetical protein
MAQVVTLEDAPRGPSILIEVPVTVNGQQRVPFPDTAQLRSTIGQTIIIKGLRLVPDAVLTNGILNASVTSPLAELQKMAITIYAEGWEKGQSIPILELNDFLIPGTFMPNRFRSTYLDNWRNVDWPKSYIQYANGTLSAGAPYVVLIDCLYIKLDANGNEIKASS